MSRHPKNIINLADVPLRDQVQGETFEAKIGRVGPMLGSTGLGCTVHVLAPGKRAHPFHRHHVIHEMFYILSGDGELRYGDKTHPLREGDIIACPAGKEAHQFVNTGKIDLRFLAFSTIGEVDVVDYPDSGKIAVAAGIKNSDFSTATYVGLGRLSAADYWDGEGNKA